jgi:hypothetical protein
MIPAAIGVVEVRAEMEVRYLVMSASSLSRNYLRFASVVPRVRPSQERLGVAIGQNRSTSLHISTEVEHIVLASTTCRALLLESAQSV